MSKTKMSAQDDIYRRRGQNLRLRREELGWSQAQLAELAGSTQQTVDRIERGVTRFSRALPAIASALGVSLVATEQQEALARDFINANKHGVAEDGRIEKHREYKDDLDRSFIRGLASGVERALRAAVVRKVRIEDQAASRVLFDASESPLSFEALAYLAVTVGATSEDELPILLLISKMKNEAKEERGGAEPPTWVSTARDILPLFYNMSATGVDDVEQESGPDIEVLKTRIGLLSITLTTKYLYGPNEAARIFNAEAQRLDKESKSNPPEAPRRHTKAS